MAKLINKLKQEIKIKEDKAKTFSIRLPKDEFEKLSIVSAATMRSKSSIIEEALKEVGIFDDTTVSYFKQVLEDRKANSSEEELNNEELNNN